MYNNDMDPNEEMMKKMTGGENMQTLLAPQREEIAQNQDDSTGDRRAMNSYTIPFRIPAVGKYPSNIKDRPVVGERFVEADVQLKEVKADEKSTFRLHASGHNIVINCTSQDGGKSFWVAASEDNIRKILCSLKRPIVIDHRNLSKVQLYGVIQAIKKIEGKIILARVEKRGRDMLIAKNIE